MQSDKLSRLLFEKAKQDQHAMNLLLREASAADEVIGFHAQQAVEKFVKAVLARRAIECRKTHHLRRLFSILKNAGIAYPPELSETTRLTAFAVEFRYDLLPLSDDASRPFDRGWAEHCIGCIADWAAAIIDAPSE